jgi:murein L,D-transpeptidase YafK
MLLIPSYAFCIEKADLVVVVKSEHRLYLKKNGKTLKEFHVVFGANPKGHKIMKGDERTPEGQYVLDISRTGNVPKKLGVDPGGFIMIHGQKNGLGRFSVVTQLFNWTDGCIALTNTDMDEVWKAVDAGIPIEIKP